MSDNGTELTNAILEQGNASTGTTSSRGTTSSPASTATERVRREPQRPTARPCLNETAFSSLAEARALLAAWRDDYKRVRSHSALANRTPEQFCTHHLALAATPVMGKTLTQELPLSGGRKGLRSPPLTPFNEYVQHFADPCEVASAR